jgi:hypothetical protein
MAHLFGIAVIKNALPQITPESWQQLNYLEVLGASIPRCRITHVFRLGSGIT